MALKANATHIKVRRTKHGPRHRWGRHEYAQAAIGVLYPFGIPPELVNRRGFRAELERAVREQLLKDPEYRARGFPLISRNTILEAAGVRHGGDGSTG
jgi:hypothetical protein